MKGSTVNRWRTRFKALFAFTKWKLLRDVNARQAQEHLADLSGKRSAKMLEDLKGDYSTFGRWLEKCKRYPENPFTDLRNPSQAMESVRKPRPLTEVELQMIATAAEAGKSFKSLSGPRRALLYRLASFTGLRSAELASLIAGQVERDAEGRVFVNVAAGCTKSKKTARQAVPEPVASDLLLLVAELWPEDRLFPGSWTSHAGGMIQADAKAAGVETVTDTPQGKRFVTFHSLRHSFAQWLKVSGVPVVLAQLMMRHADVKLTTETYGQIDDETLHQTVQGIAGNRPLVPLNEKLLPHLLPQANEDDSKRVTMNQTVPEMGNGEKGLETRGFDDECERMTMTGEMSENGVEEDRTL